MNCRLTCVFIHALLNCAGSRRQFAFYWNHRILLSPLINFMLHGFCSKIKDVILDPQDIVYNLSSSKEWTFISA